MSTIPFVTTGTASRFRLWAGKRDAVAALRAMNVHGLNVDGSIQPNPARTRFGRGWVISRPDHFNGVTFLLTGTGAWVPGRLFDASPCWCASPCRNGHAALWVDLRRGLEPATFTHVTRTVLDSANRHERYRTKSNGSCGRWVTSDDSVALCTCGWREWASTREDARWSAQRHRDEVTSSGGLTHHRAL